ncbi:DUF3575 domain-containing protein [Bacteroides sp. OttesenSCG-928-D19]|nr:DUF3575 domain-containing protein [Bacteroides sp. OttesenSCG-928-D19]
MKRLITLILLLSGFFISQSSAQKIAVKSNLLYDITSTMNLGVEVRLSDRWTIDLPVNYNPWSLADGARLRHWGVQPEARYWFCEPFFRTFIGVHAHYADFNVGRWPDWGFVAPNMKENRYQGNLLGAGVSVGYTWILKKRWSIEASLGLGYARIWYDKYPCDDCATKTKDTSRNYLGPTKAAVSLIYVIN